MNERKQTRSRVVQYSLMLAGTVVITVSVAVMLRFTKTIPRHGERVISIFEWVRGLILPHIMLLLGLGMLAGGIVLAVRRAVISKRIQHREL